MKKIVLIIAFVAGIGGLKAQDFHLSMYDGAPLFLNPSMTGVFQGDWRIHAHYRTQWKAVTFKPYITGLLSFDMPYNKWGFGGQVVNYRAGIGNYNVFQVLGSAAYSTPIDQNKSHNLALGIQGGFTQKSIEYPLHTFDNQYVTNNGGGFDQSINSGETFSGQSQILPDLNAGLMYYYARQQSKLNPFIGISAFNLLTPNESFLFGNAKVPMRFYVHTGTRINITETLFVLPKVLVMQQEEFQEQTFAVDMGYYLKNAEMYLLTGATYRNQDAMVISIGARKADYIAKIAYDFNTSTLSPATDGRGGFEVSFTYMKQRKKPKQEKICPRL